MRMYIKMNTQNLTYPFRLARTMSQFKETLYLYLRPLSISLLEQDKLWKMIQKREFCNGLRKFKPRKNTELGTVDHRDFQKGSRLTGCLVHCENSFCDSHKHSFGQMIKTSPQFIFVTSIRLYLELKGFS